MIINNYFKIGYVPTPKNACTSFKHVMFSMENNFKFKEYTINGREFHIHNFHKSYESKEFFENKEADLDFVFCIVRNPIDRIVSCYRNRVLRYGELSNTVYEKKINSINEFIENLSDLQNNIPSIKHHTSSHCFYLGKKTNVYSHIFNINQIDKAIDFLSKVSKKNLNLPHLQKGDNNHITKDDISKENLNFLEKEYEQDYKIFGEYFN